MSFLFCTLLDASCETSIIYIYAFPEFVKAFSALMPIFAAFYRFPLSNLSTINYHHVYCDEEFPDTVVLLRTRFAKE